MHELAVTESILEIALRHAEQANARQIRNLYLVIGDFSSIVDESVQFYWDLVADNTPAMGARLNFRRIPAEMECQACGGCYTPSYDQLTCPECGSAQVKLVKGDEFYLEAIDVET
mgnify:CR=1 FL=1